MTGAGVSASGAACVRVYVCDTRESSRVDLRFAVNVRETQQQRRESCGVPGVPMPGVSIALRTVPRTTRLKMSMLAVKIVQDDEDPRR